MSRARRFMIAALCGIMTAHGADADPQAVSPADDPAIPQPVKEQAFDALIANSPLTRSLGVAGSLILTGIAHVENDVFVTLLDTETMKSHVVSKTPNARGWQLVGVIGSPGDIQRCAAQIQVPGGELVTIRYEKPPSPKSMRSAAGSRGTGGGSDGGSGGNAPPLSSAQLDEAKKAAVNYKEGFNADGYPSTPPAEMIEKLSRLSTGQREDINRTMFGYRNQGLGLDERRKIYEGLVERSLQRR